MVQAAKHHRTNYRSHKIHRMDRNYLKGEDGDKINAILAGCGFNLRKLLRAILLYLFKERFKRDICDWTALIRRFGQLNQSA